MLTKLASLVTSVLVSLGLAGFLAPQPPPPPDGPPPPKKAREKGAPRKKGEREPGGELKKAYDLLRRLRAEDGASGRPEERLRDWTDRAAGLYRDGLKALNNSEMGLAREYGTAAHDLARAVDHSRSAARFDRPDPDLPPPSDDFGLEDIRDRALRDLNRAYERLEWLGTWQPGPGAEYYVKAARDLYRAARRDLAAGRDERGGELARAAEAMTHVPEHLAQVGEGRGRIGFRDDPRKDRDIPEPKGKRAEPPPPRDGELPPELPPGE
jgi:hypothetical protein